MIAKSALAAVPSNHLKEHNVTLSALLLGFVISSIIGALYHLWRGGGPWRILFYLVLAWFGFFGGALLADFKGWFFWQIGQLDVGIGILGALLLLALGDWLAIVNIGEA